MRHKFELLIKDLWQALECPGKDRSVMGTAVHGLRRFFPELMRDSVKVRQMLEFVEAQRSSEGCGRQVIEQQLMEVLRSLAWNCAGWLEEAKCPQVAGFDMTGAAPQEFHPLKEEKTRLHARGERGGVSGKTAVRGIEFPPRLLKSEVAW